LAIPAMVMAMIDLNLRTDGQRDTT
jgi:hypothetical protein